MAPVHRIYLVPGFFGFANFGELKYFAHVREQLGDALSRRGARAEMYYVQTLPTASLTRRAARLATEIAATDDGQGALHLIGHSTGGIDARLLVSPGATLAGAPPLAPLVDRVRTVVTIASPHYGAPLARAFTSVLGQSLLRALSMLTLHVIRLGTVPLPALLAMAGAIPGIGRLKGTAEGIFDQVYRQLLKDFDATRQREIEAFFATAGEDQALLPQLSPEGMDLFNAATTAPAHIRFGCVVARARPPAWRSALGIGLAPTSQATYALYRALYELASTLPDKVTPPLTGAQRATLLAAYGELPGARDNDAIVPTISQVFGDVIHAAWADHLDVIGHFTGPEAKPPHVDWLKTQSGFDRRQFAALWESVADYLLASG